jgi:E3 ubiquitin-protein ligase RNF115/126
VKKKNGIYNLLNMIFLIADFFLLGNPGEYVWGCEGLDGIVTKLLNQMDDSGPAALG